MGSRIDLVENVLKNRGPLTPIEIEEDTRLQYQQVSLALRSLKQYGLVEKLPDGRYQLKDEEGA